MLPFCGSQLVLEKRLRDWEEGRGSRQEAHGAERKEQKADDRRQKTGLSRAKGAVHDKKWLWPISYGTS